MERKGFLKVEFLMKYSAELGKDINRLLEQARELQQGGTTLTTQKVLFRKILL